MPQAGVDSVESQVSELKVSGHVMSMEPGLYCVFCAPGGPVPDGASGLPVVRIGAAPGSLGAGIEVSGLDGGGWIGPDSATLVRVSGAKAGLLVTVYQAQGATAEAPQIQVMRLAGPAAGANTAAGAAGAAVVPKAAAAPEPMEIVAHIWGRGDVGNHVGDWTGEPGSKRWIEGFGVAGIGGVPMADIEYQAVLGRGWLSPWSQGGQFCGSRGMSLPILGLRVRLRGASAETHRVVVSGTFVDGTEIGPLRDGEACEAPSLAALEAFMLTAESLAAGSGSAVAPTEARAVPPPAAKPKGRAGGKTGARGAASKKG